MTTIYTSSAASNAKTIGTHVFIVGVGEYPALLGGDPEQLLENPMGLKQLSSPPISAAALASWFLRRECGSAESSGFHNPSAPLLTVEILLSPGQKFMRPDGKELEVEPATRPNIARSFTRWKDRAAANDRNIAVFYFCGHGLLAADDYLLPSDFGVLNPSNPWADAIDITDTARAMRRLAGGPLYFFIDACRQIGLDALSPGASPPALAHLDFKKPVRGFTQLTLWSTDEGQQAFGARNEISRFTQALIEALSGYEAEAAPDASGWVVTGSLLAASVSRILETANASLEREKHQHVEQQLIGSQPFHFETTPPRQVLVGVPSSWATGPEAREWLATMPIAAVPNKDRERLAEKLESRKPSLDVAPDTAKTLSVSDYFDVVLPVMLRWKGEAATILHKRVRFSLMDEPHESWLLCLEPPVATVSRDDASQADLSIELTSKSMESILAGNFDAKKAILEGAIKLSGDLSVLRPVGQMFRDEGPAQEAYLRGDK